MKKIIEGSMQRAILVFVCMLLILAWGGISAFQMQRDYLPGINNTTLLVSVRASSYQADQVKQNVTPKLEDAIRSSDGLMDVETNSYDGGLLMNLYYPMDFNMKQAESEIKQALTSAALPSDVGAPVVTRVTTSSFPILSYSLTANNTNIEDAALRSTVEADIAKQLKSVPGVADVRVTGAANNGYVLNVRMQDLTKSGLTMDDLNQSLATALPNWSTGKVSNNKDSFPLTVNGWNLTDQELGNILIKNKQGISVPLSNVADLSHSLTDVKTVSRTNGKASILLDVLKTPSANITDVAKHVKERVTQISPIKNGDLSLTTMLDREHELNASLLGLVREGLLGCVFSMLCVFFFFRNVRSTLLIAVSLPISLLATTAVLKSMGITLNILTVSGLIVAMGRIVDDSIVVLDNMYRRYQENKDQSTLHVLSTAVKEMLPAIFASTATTIAVYIPIAMVGGVISASYSGFAWSVVIALIVSFFVAMLVVPTFAFMGWRNDTSKAVTLEPMMKPILRFAFSHKKWITSISLLIFIVAAIFASTLPVSLLPTANSGDIAIQIELPKGSALPEVDGEVQKVENVLKSNPNVASFSANFGSTMTPQADDVFDAGGGFIQQPNIANMSVALKDKNKVDSVISDLQRSLPALNQKVVYTVSNQSIAGDDKQMKIMLSGADQKTLDDAAQLVRKKLVEVQGLSVQGATDLTNGTPKYAITLDRAKIEQAGVKVEDIKKVIGQYMTGGKDFDIQADHKLIPVDMYITRVSKENATSTDVLAALAAETVSGIDGQKIRIDQLATIAPSKAPSSIQERDGQPYSTVTVQITSKDISKVSSDVDQKFKNIALPSGVTYSMGGITQQVKQMIMDMSIAVAFSILLVLLITSAVFKGWRAPMAVLLSIPLALSGVVLALMLFGGEWNLAALIGVLMLTGIVVTNGIVLIDKIERNRKEGLAFKDAIMQGSLSRVRPIFMTAGTTILTLLPLALTHSSDTVISQTLGIVVIGGMITSTLNSFLVIPTFYEWLVKKSTKS
ncbi:Multidrug efflux pump subunit AcrB [Paenibacillus sp. yr247]|uniref:efflux RND transporter permease subunit n=1 Tax=Paenibacillus sp. yr247 TaxID=1761880 RepID=UPI0008902183|nr:efflux RND transporter permease subunit [Paenibacillus sp. yr247]SDO32512.1 Multidrug efflux pump subunit AcrB [Paenibacillus sp. yr247]